jgi:hypothetical protein
MRDPNLNEIEVEEMEKYLVQIGRCTGTQLEKMTWKQIKTAYYEETK